MKKFLSLVLIFILAFSASVCGFAENKNEITPSGNVVISSSSDKREQVAAEAMLTKLNLIFGGYSYKVTDSYTAGDIVIGSSFLNYDFTGKKRGNYVIKSVDGCVFIDGNGTDGLLNGVYEFLDRFCDYEVYEKDIIRYTDADKLVLPGNINIEYEPYFEFRQIDTVSAYNPEYCHANSINSTLNFSDAEGGKVGYISEFCHTLSTQFCSSSKYFESNPEYFALRDGERTPTQLCLTNEDVVKVVTDEVLELLKSKHDPSQNLQIVSLTQADNQLYCECEKCKALDDENGSHAGTMITFANKIADVVKEKGYDNIQIDTFAYEYTRTVPTNVVPRDNVIVRLCSIECCFAHTVDDENCKFNKEFMADLEGWSKICNNLYIWDYVNNYSETFQPFPNFAVLQRNVQVFYEHGAKGLYEEGNYYMAKCNGEFYELRSYLLSKLMENPYRDDYDELMLNYLEVVYGPGGKYLKEYLDETCVLAANHGNIIDEQRMYIRQQPKYCLPGITSKQIKKFDSLWQMAKDAAENEEQLSRIEQSEISWLCWKCNRLKGEFTLFQPLSKYMKSHVDLLERIEKYGNTYVGEGTIKILRKNPARVLFLKQIYWESKYDGKIFDKFDSFAKWLYELSGNVYDYEQEDVLSKLSQ